MFLAPFFIMYVYFFAILAIVIFAGASIEIIKEIYNNSKESILFRERAFQYKNQMIYLPATSSRATSCAVPCQKYKYESM